MFSYLLKTELAIQVGTWLAQIFSELASITSGSDKAIQFVVTGLLHIAIVGFIYLFVPAVRSLEDDLPITTYCCGWKR
jgi:hypothetical protein